jgi:hypothetical protein
MDARLHVVPPHQRARLTLVRDGLVNRATVRFENGNCPTTTLQIRMRNVIN